MSPEWLYGELKNKLKNLDWGLAKKDMTNFLLDTPLEHIDRILNADSMIKKLKVSLGQMTHLELLL